MDANYVKTIPKRDLNLRSKKDECELPENEHTNCSHDFIRSEGFFACQNCGEVGERIFENNQPRAYTSEEKDKRLFRKAVPPNRKGPRTKLSSRYDAWGKPIRKFNWKLSLLNAQLKDPLERHAISSGVGYNFMRSKTSIPRVVFDTAQNIYLKAVEEGLIRGEKKENFLLSSLLIALRIHKHPHSIIPLIKAYNCDYLLVMRSYRKMLKNLKTLPKVLPLTAKDFSLQFCEVLGVPVSLSRKIHQLCKVYEYTNGYNPKGVACAAIYLITKKNDLDIRQNHLAKLGNVSEVTIRSRVNDLKNFIKAKNKAK